MTKIKVSVVIPVHNVEAYLSECLDSVCGQTRSDIEIICVDDGSTDASLQILKEYAGKDDRIKIITQENAGAGAARNKGLDAAKGEYLSFLDADDVFEPDMLSEAVSVCEAYDADYCVFDHDLFSDNIENRSLIEWAMVKKHIPNRIPFCHSDVGRDIFLIFTPTAWNKLFSAKFVRNKGLRFQEIKNTNDMYFTFSALFHAERIVPIFKILAHYRVGNEKALSVARTNSWDCFYTALSAVKEELIKIGLYEAYKQEYANALVHYFFWQLNSLEGQPFLDCFDRIVNVWAEESGLTSVDDDYFYRPEECSLFRILLRGEPLIYLEACIKTKAQYISWLEAQRGELEAKYTGIEIDLREKLEAQRGAFEAKCVALETDLREKSDEIQRIRGSKSFRYARKLATLLVRGKA